MRRPFLIALMLLAVIGGLAFGALLGVIAIGLIVGVVAASILALAGWGAVRSIGRGAPAERSRIRHDGRGELRGPRA